MKYGGHAKWGSAPKYEMGGNNYIPLHPGFSNKMHASSKKANPKMQCPKQEEESRESVYTVV